MPFFSVFFFYVRFCLTYDFKMLINDGKYTWITQWRREQIERGGGLDLSKIVTPVLPPVPTPIHYKLLHIYILDWKS